MENKRIIYPTDEGEVVVITPAVGCGLTIEEIAAKDVPALISYEKTGEIDEDENGDPFEVMRKIVSPRQFKIIDASDIPEDRTFRNAWEFAK